MLLSICLSPATLSTKSTSSSANSDDCISSPSSTCNHHHNHHHHHYPRCLGLIITTTGGLIILTKGHITVLLHLMAANGFVRPWPHLIKGSLDSHDSDPKLHLDQFRRFCRAHKCDQQTHTDRPCYSVCSNSSHLTQCMWCGLIIIWQWQLKTVNRWKIRWLGLRVDSCLVLSLYSITWIRTAFGN